MERMRAGMLIEYDQPNLYTTTAFMDIVFNIFLILHIVGGTIGLLTGLINIIRKKGDKPHKLVGRMFYYSMLTAGGSSLVLSNLHPSLFLFMVGVFTLYMVVSGQRYLKHKQEVSHADKQIDWAVTLFMLLAGLLFIGIGISGVVRENYFGIVYIVFGGLGLLFVRQDYYNFRGKSILRNYWQVGHLQRMTGAFIASLTAFLVVNSKYIPDIFPGFLYWILPTIILTPLIIKWSRKNEVRKSTL